MMLSTVGWVVLMLLLLVYGTTGTSGGGQCNPAFFHSDQPCGMQMTSLISHDLCIFATEYHLHFRFYYWLADLMATVIWTNPFVTADILVTLLCRIFIDLHPKHLYVVLLTACSCVSLRRRWSAVTTWFVRYQWTCVQWQMTGTRCRPSTWPRLVSL